MVLKVGAVFLPSCLSLYLKHILGSTWGLELAYEISGFSRVGNQGSIIWQRPQPKARAGVVTAEVMRDPEEGPWEERRVRECAKYVQPGP